MVAQKLFCTPELRQILTYYQFHCQNQQKICINIDTEVIYCESLI